MINFLGCTLGLAWAFVVRDRLLDKGLGWWRGKIEHDRGVCWVLELRWEARVIGEPWFWGFKTELKRWMGLILI